jgi:hypothetical protein
MQLYRPERSTRNKAQLLWTLIWLGCTVVAFGLKADGNGHGTHQQLGLPPCPSVLLFDRPCPGCGLTTSWTALVHGQLLTSLKAHPLGWFMYGTLTFVGLGCLWGNIRGKRMLVDTPTANRILVGFIIVFFIFGLARMALSPNYAATKKELLWRAAMEQERR